MASDGSTPKTAPIQLEYATTARPRRPMWLTAVRAAGVATSFVVGLVGGYWVALAIILPLNHFARALKLEWASNRPLGTIDAAILLAGVVCGAFVGTACALKLCRKYPQWTRH